MKVIDVIKKFQEYITTEDVNKDYDLCYIYHLVEHELAYDYFPVYCEENFTESEVEFKNFKFPIIRLVQFDNPLIIVDDSCMHTCDGSSIGRVKYAYAPTAKNMEDDTCYSEDYMLILVYGMLSEYYIQIADYETAYTWTSTYKKAINNMYVKIGEKKNVN